MNKEGKEGRAQFGIANFERRKTPRFSMDLPVEYSPVDSGPRLVGTGRTGNGSEGGLMLYLPGELKVGQSLRIRLYFSSAPGLDSIEVVAEVVWVEFPFAQEGDHRYGVRFLEISPEALIRLKNFLDNLAQIKPPLRIAP
jgi:c-di-GMP-binding flagellar brake protein YcgR